MTKPCWKNVITFSALIFIANLFLCVQSCTKDESTKWEDRPGINVEGETLEEACLIARQHISECYFEGREHDGSIVFVVDWDKRCTEDNVLRLQWMPCEEVMKEFP